MASELTELVGFGGFNAAIARAALDRFNVEYGADLTLDDFAAMARRMIDLGHPPSPWCREPFSSRHKRESLDHAVLIAFGESLGQLLSEQIGTIKAEAIEGLCVLRKEIEASRKKFTTRLRKALLGQKGEITVAWGPVLEKLAPGQVAGLLSGLDELTAVLDAEVARWSEKAEVEVLPRSSGRIASMRGPFAYLLTEAFRDQPSVMPRKVNRAIALLWIASGSYEVTGINFKPRLPKDMKNVMKAVREALCAQVPLWDPS